MRLGRGEKNGEEIDVWLWTESEEKKSVLKREKRLKRKKDIEDCSAVFVFLKEKNILGVDIYGYRKKFR